MKDKKTSEDINRFSLTTLIGIYKRGKRISLNIQVRYSERAFAYLRNLMVGQCQQVIDS